MVFVTEDRPHDTYVRQGLSDLLTVRTVSLEEALCGLTITLKTLDDRTLRVHVTDVITPTYEKVVEDEGLPLLPCPTKAKGNLIIRFHLEFPKYLSKRAKDVFADAFEVSEKEAEKFKKLKCGTLETD